MDKRIAILRSTSASLRRIAEYPVPERSAATAQEVLDHYSRVYSQALDRASRRCDQLARRWEAAFERAGEKGLTAEMTMSFNMQYLMLQEKMQRENREISMISNIMKTKHDTVKNTIYNVR